MTLGRQNIFEDLGYCSKCMYDPINHVDLKKRALSLGLYNKTDLLQSILSRKNAIFQHMHKIHRKPHLM